ncbi:MAG: class I adenylate-forming enzyme family protein [Proteobacteria bacterium]|jgi:long-chain acyl-CoA synthetase|nr:class I adenylate-forming enzyme family protein [Pseudomonadota bacterium]
MNVYQSFVEVVERYKGRPAVIYLGEVLNYGDLFEAVECFSTGLKSLGIKEREKIILYMPNTPQWIISWLSIQKIGAVAVPIAPIYTSRDLRYISGDSGTRTVICADTNFGYAKELKEEGALDNIIITRMGDLLPRYKKLIGKAFDRIPEGKIEKGEGIFRFTELMKKRTTMEGFPVNEHEPLEILYTGGTTKNPKGVPINHALFLESVRAQMEESYPIVPPPENITLQGGPLFHILGQVFGLGPLCVTGDCVVVMPKVNIDAFLYFVKNYRIKTFFGVPALYRMILEHDRVDYYDLSSLVYCFSGGDVLPQEIARRWKEKFGREIFEGYGATETCGGITMSPVVGERPPGTIGKVLYTKKVKILDESTGEEVPDGEAGELIVSSEHMVYAYWNKEEETKESYIEKDGLRWYKTGDIVKRDSNSFYYFVDRTADTIKHKGYRVSSSEIEAALQDHPAVFAACAVGVPDEKVGERIKAFVVLKQDVKGVTGYNLIHWCRNHLASYKVPHYIEFRDMLPKSKVGKLLRRELRQEERKRFEE